ncbi:MAG: hypothetical protein MJ084_07115 [Saccharofermentans sp.]|nr:hypothetical protein [Saccharofermentans sp.]
MKNKKLFVLALVFLAIIGLVVFFMRDLVFGGVVTTYDIACRDTDAYSDQWVSYEVAGCLGEYCEGTDTYGFIPTGHQYYYVVWMNDGSFMPISVSKKADKEYLDSLTDATYYYLDDKTDYIMSEPRTFVGTVKKTQESEAAGYYREALDDFGINGMEYTIHNELFDCTSSKTNYIVMISLLTCLPIICIIVSFVSEGPKTKKQLQSEETFLPQ